MNKPSKSKVPGDPSTYNPMTEKEMASLRRDIFAESAANSRDAETLRALQFALAPLPESERQILRCAPLFDAQAEHEKDLEHESRVDYASWETESEQEYNQRMDEREQDRYDMQEAE